ncbi:MAG: hypothetical protein Q8R83_07515 [Legionellaceae bacterium]|nr:hypothetical protein [Legionellaceae bacterium]
MADKYHLSALNDLQTSIAVNLYLEEIGNKKLRHTLFGKPSYFGGNWQNFNWALYEPVARELYFKIARENPISVIKVYLKIMPEVFYENILYLSGMKSTDKEQDYIEGALLSKHERDTKNLYYKLLRPEVSILLIMGIILYIVNDYRFIKKSNNAHIFCSTLIVAIFSFMPCMLIVPTLQYIQVFLTLLTTLFYLGFIIVIKNAGYRLIYICDKVSYHISLLMPRSYLL